MNAEDLRDGADQVKAEVYEAMAVINRSFEQIMTALYKLEWKGVLKEGYTYSQEVPMREMVAKINCYVLSKVNERELDDRNHYSKMRANMEGRKGK